MKTFSEKVKNARAELGLSQMKLGEIIGVTGRSIQSYEQGLRMPHRGTMLRLAKALNVSVKFLSDDECENPLEDIEKDGYVEDAWAKYGPAGVRDAERLLADSAALFAGGDLSQEQKDEFFRAVMTAYVTCREEAKEKFGHNDKK